MGPNILLDRLTITATLIKPEMRVGDCRKEPEKKFNQGGLKLDAERGHFSTLIDMTYNNGIRISFFDCLVGTF
jgi:hypothetical protein